MHEITLLEQGPLQGHNAWEYVREYTSVNKHFSSRFVVSLGSIFGLIAAMQQCLYLYQMKLNSPPQ